MPTNVLMPQMGESIVERLFRGIADMLGRIEIGFANFEVND